MATLIARELDYDILELNASDTRNKKQLDATLLDAVSSRAIVTSGGCSLKKRLIIMDEVGRQHLSIKQLIHNCCIERRLMVWAVRIEVQLLFAKNLNPP